MPAPIVIGFGLTAEAVNKGEAVTQCAASRSCGGQFENFQADHKFSNEAFKLA